MLFAFADDLPEISALDDYSPGIITRVIGRDGSFVGEFATERRQIISYEEIPPVVRHAIISAEDDEFMTHGGIHPILMAWAAVNDVLARGRTPGRSTITQQLARQLFPETVGFERAGMAGRIRKVKEALVALRIEKRYSKSEILTMYCNKVAWGNRAFGIEAASKLYFGKPAKEVKLNEAAFGTLIGPGFLDNFVGATSDDLLTNFQTMRSFVRTCVAKPLSDDDFETALCWNVVVPAQMSDEQREVFVLCEIEGLSGAEAAALLELNENTVWTRLRAARRIFQEGVTRQRARLTRQET